MWISSVWLKTSGAEKVWFCTQACSSLCSSSLFRLANSLAPRFCLALPSNMNCWWSSTAIVGFRYAWCKSSNWDQWRHVFLSLSALFLHASACVTAGKKLGHELHSMRECWSFWEVDPVTEKTTRLVDIIHEYNSRFEGCPCMQLEGNPALHVTGKKSCLEVNSIFFTK